MALRTFFILFSLKQSERRIVVIIDFPSQIPFLAKSMSWVFALYALNQSYYRIPENSISQEWVEAWNRLFVCDWQSNWAWSDIARHNPKLFKIVYQEYIQKTDMVNFFTEPRKQKFLWNHCCPSIFHCFSWSAEHLSRSHWLVSFWSF